ncbi:uncharacterized protein VP01_84g9 [Puccinia sorghi]|uniref:Uncharacterized protein n=1 Tax=Puccinia sorghi TaxID=27349 RepID=A0A0L6U970_9BASI|nr:uncharacterized protein VP01_84g9 [Puccinia sorghi]
MPTYLSSKPLKIDLFKDMKNTLHAAGLSLQDDLANGRIHPTFCDNITHPSPPDLYDEDIEVKARSYEGNICEFGDGPFPPVPLPELTKLGLLLRARPEICKYLVSPEGISSCVIDEIQFNLTADYCQMHQAKTDIIPEGITCGWPTHREFGSLKQSASHQGSPQGLVFYIEERGPLVIFGYFHEHLASSWCTERSEWYEVIYRTLISMFISPAAHNQTAHLACPLSPDFLCKVLVPETALCLIAKDLNTTPSQPIC